MEYRQVVEKGSQETSININYEDRTFEIYTNRASVMNRISRLGYEPYRVEKVNGVPCGLHFKFKTHDIGKFLRTGVFKFDSVISDDNSIEGIEEN